MIGREQRHCAVLYRPRQIEGGPYSGQELFLRLAECDPQFPETGMMDAAGASHEVLDFVKLSESFCMLNLDIKGMSKLNERIKNREIQSVSIKDRVYEVSDGDDIIEILMRELHLGLNQKYDKSRRTPLFRQHGDTFLMLIDDSDSDYINDTIEHINTIASTITYKVDGSEKKLELHNDESASYDNAYKEQLEKDLHNYGKIQPPEYYPVMQKIQEERPEISELFENERIGIDLRYFPVEALIRYAKNLVQDLNVPNLKGVFSFAIMSSKEEVIKYIHVLLRRYSKPGISSYITAHDSYISSRYQEVVLATNFTDFLGLKPINSIKGDPGGDVFLAYSRKKVEEVVNRLGIVEKCKKYKLLKPKIRYMEYRYQLIVVIEIDPHAVVHPWYNNPDMSWYKPYVDAELGPLKEMQKELSDALNTSTNLDFGGGETYHINIINSGRFTNSYSNVRLEKTHPVISDLDCQNQYDWFREVIQNHFHAFEETLINVSDGRGYSYNPEPAKDFDYHKYDGHMDSLIRHYFGNPLYRMPEHLKKVNTFIHMELKRGDIEEMYRRKLNLAKRALGMLLGMNNDKIPV